MIARGLTKKYGKDAACTLPHLNFNDLFLFAGVHIKAPTEKPLTRFPF